MSNLVANVVQSIIAYFEQVSRSFAREFTNASVLEKCPKSNCSRKTKHRVNKRFIAHRRFKFAQTIYRLTNCTIIATTACNHQHCRISKFILPSNLLDDRLVVVGSTAVQRVMKRVKEKNVTHL